MIRLSQGKCGVFWHSLAYEKTKKGRIRCKELNHRETMGNSWIWYKEHLRKGWQLYAIVGMLKLPLQTGPDLLIRQNALNISRFLHIKAGQPILYPHIALISWCPYNGGYVSESRALRQEGLAAHVPATAAVLSVTNSSTASTARLGPFKDELIMDLMAQ